MKKLIATTMVMVILFASFSIGVYADTSKFKDVKDSDWFAEYVGKLNVLKIIDGYNGKFNPAGNVTRAEFVKMLVQAMGYKKVDGLSFKDIKPFPTNKPHWSAVYVETALRNGVIDKDEIGENFFPDVPLNRLDMAVMVSRALKLQPSTGDNPFIDMVEANGYVTKVYEEYIVRGSIEGGKRLYKPAGLTTRAEAAAILSRVVDYKADPEQFKANYALQERFENGTYTEADLDAKAKIELERQQKDKNYIPEPIIKYDYTSFIGLYVRGTLVNVKDYLSGTTFSVVSTNYPDLNKQAHGTARGVFVENDMTRILDARSAGEILINIPIYDAKKVNGKVEYYKYELSKGSKVNYVLTVKRGNVTKKINITVAIQ